MKCFFYSDLANYFWVIKVGEIKSDQNYSAR